MYVTKLNVYVTKRKGHRLHVIVTLNWQVLKCADDGAFHRFHGDAYRVNITAISTKFLQVYRVYQYITHP